MRTKHAGWLIPILISLIFLSPIAIAANAEEKSAEKKTIRRETLATNPENPGSAAPKRELKLQIPDAVLGKPDRFLKFSEPYSLESVRGIAQAAGDRGTFNVTRHVEVKPEDVALGRSEGQTCVFVRKGNYKLERIKGGYLASKKSHFFELPEGVKVTGVRLVAPRYREVTITDKTQRILPGAEPARLRIAANKGKKERPEPAAIKLKKQKKTEKFYPAQAVTFNAIKGRKKTLVSVQFMPVLFQPLTGRVIVITEADIEVSYSR